MLSNNSIAVVVPCYNEVGKIKTTLSTIPDYVDHIYVVDDASTDGSSEKVAACIEADQRILLLQHDNNSGVGAAIATGYIRALEDGIDITAVMAGDGQMDPGELKTILQPIIDGRADYVKGNRFFDPSTIGEIPKIRLFGNLVLSAFTKIVTGYWHVSDSQCGFTAINKRALSRINLEKIYPRYGCPNDILAKLNIANQRVAEVKVKPIYGEQWASKMKVTKIIFPMLGLLFSLFLSRIYHKYICLNGHPIVFYYMIGSVTFSLSVLLSLYILLKLLLVGLLPKAALILFGIMITVSIQLWLAAFSMDYDSNKQLCVILNGSSEH